MDDENREITLAKEQLETVEGELAVTVIEVIRQFSILLPVGVDKDDWETWWVEGWFRQFCRSVSRLLLLSSSSLQKADLVPGNHRSLAPRSSLPPLSSRESLSSSCPRSRPSWPSSTAQRVGSTLLDLGARQRRQK